MEEQKVIEYFLGLLNQIKLFHWSTSSYAIHKALDDFHSSLSDKIDNFIEVYIGKFKKQPFKNFKINMEAVSDITKLDKFLESEREQVRKMHNQFKTASELQNILDEIMSEFNKTIYLCNLK